MKTRSLFFLFVIGFFINGYSQTNHQFHLPSLSADATWSGVAWENQFGGMQGGAPFLDDTVFIDLDNLNGHTLIVDGVNDMCMSLFVNDGVGIGNSGTLRLSSPLKLTGGSTGLVPITLQLHPNLISTSDNPDDRFFDLVGNAGGVISSAIPGTPVNIASAKINSSNYSIPYTLNENSVFGNLSVYQGYFKSNGHSITLNKFFCGNDFTQNVVLDVNASVLHVNTMLNWRFHNNPSYPNYTGLGTFIYIDQITSQASVIIGGKITSPIEHVENTSSLPLNIGTANSFKNVINNLICHTSFYHYQTDYNPGYNHSLRIVNLEVSQGEIGFYEPTPIVPGSEMEIDNITIVSPGCLDRVNLVFRGDHSRDAKIIFNNPISLSKVGVRNIQAANNTFSLTNSIDMGGNSGSISFIGASPAPTNSTWTGAINTDWNNPGNWNDGCIPGLNTNVLFVDGAITDTVKTNVYSFCNNMLWSNMADQMVFDVMFGLLALGDGTYLANGDAGNRVYVNGNLNFSNPAVLTNNNTSTFVFAGNGSITSNSVPFKGSIYIEATGSYSLVDSLRISLPPAYAYYRGNFSVLKGGFNSNAKNMHVYWFLSGGKFIRSVNVSDSKIWILMSGNIGSQVFFDNQFNNLTLIANNNSYWIFDPITNTGVSSVFSMSNFSSPPLAGNVISRCLLGNKLMIQAYSCGAPVLFNKVIKEKGDIEFNKYYNGSPTFQMDSLVYRSSGNVFFESYPTSVYTVNITGGIGTENGCLNSYKLAAHSTTTGDPVTINFSAAPNSVTVNNCVIENIISSPNQLINESVLLGNSSGWTVGALTPADYYWIGEAPTPVWSDWRNWLPSILPSPFYGDTLLNLGHCVPKFSDNVFFHPNSFPGSTDVSVNSSIAFNDMEWLNGIGLPVKNVTGNSDMAIYGSFLLNQDMNMLTYSGDFNFLATDTGNTIRSKTNLFNGSSDFIFNNTGAWTLLDSLSAIGSGLFHNKGNLNLSNASARLRTFQSVTIFNRQLNINNAKIFINDWPGGFGINSTNLTYIDNLNSKITLMNPNTGLFIPVSFAGTPSLNLNASIEFIGSTATNCDGLGLGLFFNLNNTTVHKLTFNKIDGGFHEGYGDNISVVTDCVFDSLILAVGHTYKIKEGRTITVNSLLDANGTPCTRTKIFPVDEYYSSIPSVIPAYLCLAPGGNVNASFLELSNIQSASCSGFTINYPSLFSETNSGTTGWAATAYSGLLPGLGLDTVIGCTEFPYSINTSGLVPNNQSVINWSTNEHSDTISISGPGTYYVSVDYACNCTRSDTIEILLNGNLEVNIDADSISCYGLTDGSAIVDVTNLVGTFDYSWSPSGGTGVTATNLAEGNYTVTVTETTNNCTGTATVTIAQPNPIIITGVEENALCFGENNGSIDITVVGGTPEYNYNWSNGAATQDISSLMPGSYYLSLTDANGCMSGDTFTVVAPPLIIVNLDSMYIIWLGESVELNAVATGGTGNLAYNWNPTDYLTCPDCPTTQAAPILNTNYAVVVTDENGCTATADAFIEVMYALYVPNTFTPNGDGDNEQFFAVSEGVKNFSMRIFDKWGEEIFTSSSIHDGWDGSCRGAQSQQDVYVYKIEATFINGKFVELIGQVNLLR